MAILNLKITEKPKFGFDLSLNSSYFPKTDFDDTHGTTPCTLCAFKPRDTWPCVICQRNIVLLGCLYTARIILFIIIFNIL